MPNLMLESPGLLTVGIRDLAHSLARLREHVAAGGWVRIVDGSRPDADPLWLTAEPPPWYGDLIEDDMPALRTIIRQRKATRGPRREDFQIHD